MNSAMGHLSGGRLIDAAGIALLDFLWQAPAIAVLLAFVLWLSRKNSPRVRCAACSAALLLLAAVPPVTMCWLLLAPSSDLIDQVRVVHATVALAPSAREKTKLPDPIVYPATVESASTPRPAATPPSSEQLVPAVVILWSGIVACGAVGICLAWALLRRRFREAVDVPAPWSAKVGQFARQLGVRRPVRVVQCAVTKTPMTVGWLRPLIILPTAAVEGLPEVHLKALIAHEMAHIQRCDYLQNLLHNFVSLALFFQPLVWWIRWRIDVEREYCCDDMAWPLVGDRATYLEALCSMEDLRGPGYCALGVTANGGQLLTRSKRLAEASWMPTLSIGHCFYLGLLAAVLAYVAAPRSASLELAGDAAAKPSAADLRLWPPQPVLFEEVPHPSANPREVVLPENGRLAFTHFVTPQYHRQSYSLRLPRPAQIQVQVIPMTQGFRPHLQCIWVNEADETIVDGDIECGRGGRPSLVLASLPQTPDVSVELNVFGRDMHNSDLPWPFGRYILYLRTLDHPHDHDDDLLGFAAAPIVLDSSGQARLEAGVPPLPLALECPGDVDTFQFQPESDRPLRITVEPLDGRFAADLRVFADDGRPVALVSTAASTGHATAQIVPQAGRRYYLAVSALDGQATGDYVVAIIRADRGLPPR